MPTVVLSHNVLCCVLEKDSGFFAKFICLTDKIMVVDIKYFSYMCLGLYHFNHLTGGIYHLEIKLKARITLL